MDILKIAGRIYDKNPVSYRVLRNLKQSMTAAHFFLAAAVLPAIPVWNVLALLEVKKIHAGGSIYKAGRETLFYLPKLDLKAGEFIQNRIFLEGNYFEWRRLLQARKYIKKKGVVLDIGANLGNHTLFFLKECGAERVYAFEPVKSTFQILKKNIFLNHLQDKAVLYNTALGEKRCGARVVYNPADAGGNRVEAAGGGYADTVMYRLDDFRIPEHIDFIKIDVEGYEQMVLQGAGETLRRNRPVIMIEIFDENYGRVNDCLCSIGYRCRMKVENDYIYAI